MAEAVTKLPVKNEQKVTEPASAFSGWWPFERLRRDVDRLFEDFDLRFPLRRSFFDIEPLWRRELTWPAAPAVDIVEKDNAFELVADVPGFDEKNIEVKIANGGLTIKGEKQDTKEEKRKDYHLNERQFASFERSFRLPEGIDSEKIEANFKQGVLTVTFPKTAEAQKAEKKITVKAA
jgi:HSP20 family protein